MVQCWVFDALEGVVVATNFESVLVVHFQLTQQGLLPNTGRGQSRFSSLLALNLLYNAQLLLSYGLVKLA